MNAFFGTFFAIVVAIMLIALPVGCGDNSTAPTAADSSDAMTVTDAETTEVSAGDAALADEAQSDSAVEDTAEEVTEN